MKLLRFPLLIFLFVIIADQTTKIWAVNNLAFNRPVQILGDLIQFNLIYNEGGAMGTNFGSSTYYLIAALLILIFVIYYLYLNRHNPAIAIPLSFISGGAVGNLIDRIAYGKVVDFIDIDFIDINLFNFHLERWWTFNIADSAISLSICFLLYNILFVQPKIDARKNSENNLSSIDDENLNKNLSSD